MQVVHFIYKDQPVDFEAKSRDNVMVNATQMAKIFGKLPKDFLVNDNTKAFIKVCLEKGNSPFLGIETEQDLVTSRKMAGTWMHRVLALKFAAWLDPAFEFWVFSTIDKLINQNFREQQNAMLEKIDYRAKKLAKKHELLLKYPEFADYFELEEKEKEAQNKQSASIKEQFKQLNLDFYSSTN